MSRTLFDTFIDKNSSQMFLDLFKNVPAFLFEHDSCEGKSAAVPNPSEINKPVTEWKQGVLKKYELRQSVSSVMVPPGYQLELFSENAWGGFRHTIVGKLRDDLKGMVCHDLRPLGFNDGTRSLKFQKLQIA